MTYCRRNQTKSVKCIPTAIERRDLACTVCGIEPADGHASHIGMACLVGTEQDGRGLLAMLQDAEFMATADLRPAEQIYQVAVVTCKRHRSTLELLRQLLCRSGAMTSGVIEVLRAERDISKLSPQVQERLRARRCEECHDCGMPVGYPHEEGCDVATCLTTGHQKLSCGVLRDTHPGDCGEDVWTGYWPGTIQAAAAGLWASLIPGRSWQPSNWSDLDAIPDLNGLTTMGTWDRQAHRWIMSERSSSRSSTLPDQ